ncbi:hypothetical protein HWD35_12700 [Tsukamurella tyrosinosolvens]|uniref:Uncharacterized protein n=1 Tax=Tsukamurella tyrosinosolvens TaxID=57704 RepID=A0A1H4XWY6_TSUTY|nr:hypothetical protein [Tsukamurella tyrosinosolvens]KXO99967.1 hypothetical protein AXK58_01915 [Tsukamurella tyrosinosolvens]KXP04548.1 hypothetical protein AXK59_14205 [Tsukamurella tyrosinosolvens]KZL97801.1 hypothetical protein AXX05_02405 [Tsukamurella tyrosinosolvens]MCA4995571.1 hypothetical protein [Tsukamurella tyrosinosolvens]WEL92048.1 hypothetical protein P1N98_12735 [Tsukamurella tyrosinosolvens]
MTRIKEPVTMDERRAMIRVIVSGLNKYDQPVSQQMRDFVEGKVEDPGPLPSPESLLRLRRRTWWQRMLGR